MEGTTTITLDIQELKLKQIVGVNSAGDFDLTINGTGKLTLNTPPNDTINGIYVKELIINGGNINITVRGGDSYDGIVTSQGGISISGSNTVVNVSSQAYGLNVHNGSLTINGGTVNVDGERGGIIAQQGIRISGGKVKAKSERGFGISSSQNINISAGSVEAEGTDGIHAAQRLSISGADTVLKAKSNTANNGAISAADGIDINDGLKIVKPDGGKVEIISGYYYIVNGGVKASEVEIRKPVPVADDFVVTLPSNTLYDGKPKTATAKPVPYPLMQTAARVIWIPRPLIKAPARSLRKTDSHVKAMRLTDGIHRQTVKERATRIRRR